MSMGGMAMPAATAMPTAMASGASMGSAMGMPMASSGFCGLMSGPTGLTGAVMQKGFKASFEDGGMCIVYLFQGAVMDTAGKYAAGVIGTFFLAFTNELIRWLRGRAMAGKAPFDNKFNLNRLSPFAREVVLGAFYLVQMLDAYWLMLLVMTYETFLFVAILLGLAAGFITFNYMDTRARACAALPSKAAPAVATPPQFGSDDGAAHLDNRALSAQPETAVAAWAVSGSTPCCDGAACRC